LRHDAATNARGDNTARTTRPEQHGQNNTARTTRPEQHGQNNTAREIKCHRRDNDLGFTQTTASQEEVHMSAANLKVTGINHVVLHVTDMTRSRNFYIGILGFEDRNAPGESDPKRSFLLCGTQGIDLFEIPGDAAGGKEMNHMALSVAAEQLDDAIDELARAGIATSEPTRRNSVFIFDPDGHQIEILPQSAHERERERETLSATHP
jgi:catechol 2,3-dioxygenase-like lactoylglutathione lyase family enzyme